MYVIHIDIDSLRGVLMWPQPHMRNYSNECLLTEEESVFFLSLYFGF